MPRRFLTCIVPLWFLASALSITPAAAQSNCSTWQLPEPTTTFWTFDGATTWILHTDGGDFTFVDVGPGVPLTAGDGLTIDRVTKCFPVDEPGVTPTVPPAATPSPVPTEIPEPTPESEPTPEAEATPEPSPSPTVQPPAPDPTPTTPPTDDGSSPPPVTPEPEDPTATSTPTATPTTEVVIVLPGQPEAEDDDTELGEAEVLGSLAFSGQNSAFPVLLGLALIVAGAVIVALARRSAIPDDTRV